jgi:glycosyltransferase involved in cell wall biosynthesis
MFKQIKASISVIIPCYNCHETISRAVDSVAAQTLTPAEIILVDDGSTDNTQNILNTLQDKYNKDYGDNWIKIICLGKNRGVSVARNTGWELASQDYIAFLDADDAWHPQKIHVQYSWMMEHPEVILSAHPCIVSRSSILPNIKIPKSIDAKLISRYQILSSNKFYTPCVVIKRNIKHRFNDSKRYCEDYLLVLEIILDGEKAAILNHPMTSLFKEYFGESGLSSKLWKMERSELDNYTIIWKKGYTSFAEMLVFVNYSFIKYLRRLGIQYLREFQKNFQRC